MAEKDDLSIPVLILHSYTSLENIATVLALHVIERYHERLPYHSNNSHVIY